MEADVLTIEQSEAASDGLQLRKSSAAEEREELQTQLHDSMAAWFSDAREQTEMVGS